MKTRVGQIAVVAILAVWATVAAACGNVHEHAFGSTWTFDETHHWHACDGCAEKEDYAEHTWAERVVTATCAEQGYTEHSCACGYSYRDGYTATLPHQTVPHEGKAATCTEDGWQPYETCANCDYTTFVAIPAAHTPVTDAAVPAGCTQSGLTEGSHCAKCGQTLVAQTTVPATGHSYAAAWTFDERHHWHAATCGHTDQTDGMAEHDLDGNGQCTVCDFELTATPELRFTLNGDGKSYSVSGLDTRLVEVVDPDDPDGTPQLYAKHPDVVNVPAQHEGLPVTAVAASAFSGIKEVRKVRLPQTVVEIGAEAFKDCVRLKTVALPANLTKIGDRAFYGCDTLVSATVPASVTDMGLHAFVIDGIHTVYCEAAVKPAAWGNWVSENVALVWDCKNNNADANGYIYATVDGLNYRLKDGVAMLRRQSDEWSGALAIPSSVTYDGTQYAVRNIVVQAFVDCASLESVTVPASVQTIGYGAFAGCTSLESLTVPFVGISRTLDPDDTQYNLFGTIFGNATHWHDEIYGSDVYEATQIYTYIRNSTKRSATTTFYIPTSLKTVAVVNAENTVITIDYGAFSGCRIENIKLYERVYCREGAFTKPSSSGFDQSYFYNCTGVKTATVKADDVRRLPKDALQSLTVTSGVLEYPDTCSGCATLESVTLSVEVTGLGQSVFSGCTALTDITYGGTKADWVALDKTDGWDTDTGDYVVHCTDGDITKPA